MGASEVLAGFALMGGAFAWLNREFKQIDKRLDSNRDDINGLGSRLTLFEQGTVEVLEEKISQIKDKQIHLEDFIGKKFETLTSDINVLFSSFWNT
jgi:hypothetical protein